MRVGIELREASAHDDALLRRAIFTAWTWRDPWDEVAFRAQAAARAPDSYVDDFGRRPGDAGLVALELGPSGERFVGAAWYRYFTGAEHRAGFVAPDVPELVVAVESGARGRGTGRWLVERLVDTARRRGVDRLSLHVSSKNERARRLYEALGFQATEHGDEHGAVMLLRTAAASEG